MKVKLITLSFNPDCKDTKISDDIEGLRKEIFARCKNDECVYVFKSYATNGKMHVHILTDSVLEKKDLEKHWKHGFISITAINNLDECFQCMRYMRL